MSKKTKLAITILLWVAEQLFESEYSYKMSELIKEIKEGLKDDNNN